VHEQAGPGRQNNFSPSCTGAGEARGGSSLATSANASSSSFISNSFFSCFVSCFGAAGAAPPAPLAADVAALTFAPPPLAPSPCAPAAAAGSGSGSSSSSSSSEEDEELITAAASASACASVAASSASALHAAAAESLAELLCPPQRFRGAASAGWGSGATSGTRRQVCVEVGAGCLSARAAHQFMSPPNDEKSKLKGSSAGFSSFSRANTFSAPRSRSNDMLGVTPHLPVRFTCGRGNVCTYGEVARGPSSQ
jgi:hypothetical protein